MRVLTLSLALAINVLGSACGHSPSPPPARPGLVVLDFGVVRPHIDGEIQRRSFHWRYAGADPFTPSRIVASCGCMAADVTPELIQPGAAAQINLRLDLTGRDGNIVSRIRMIDVTRASAQTFEVRCAIDRRLSVVPDKIVLRGYASAAKVQARLVVRHPSGTRLACSSSDLDLTVERRNAVHGSQVDVTEFRIVALPAKRASRAVGTLSVVCYEGKTIEGSMQVPVSLVSDTPLFCDPPLVRFRGGEDGTRTIRLRLAGNAHGLDNHPPKLLRATPGVSVVSLKRTPDGGVEGRVSMAKNSTGHLQLRAWGHTVDVPMVRSR